LKSIPTYFELLDAFRLSDECAFCFLAHRAGQPHLDSTLCEKVNDTELRMRLITAGGYCNHHSHVLQSFNDGLGVSIMYGDVVNAFEQWMSKADAWKRALSFISGISQSKTDKIT